MFKAKVSIIIPTFNRKHLLSNTLNNILNQNLPPYEVIVIDDHSTDGTIEWLKNEFPAVMAITSQGKGPGAARNAGIKQASGNYIQFFDSDDLMTPNKLEVQVKLLGRRTDTFIYGPYAIASAPPEKWVLKDAILQYKPIPDDNLLKWVYRGWCSITQACLFPKELVDKIGPWREDIYTHEDRDYWYRVAKLIKSPPIHENITCTIYRQHSNQLTLATERLLQRSQDSLILDNQFLFDGHYKNMMSHLILTGRIHSTRKYINKIKKTQNSFSDVFYSRIHQLINKIQRIKTNNNWQPMHGATTDLDIFNQYISLFTNDFLKK